jgi:hypothetical protein
MKLTKEQQQQRAQELVTRLPNMNLTAIALECRRDWAKPYFGVKPYLEAMMTMDSIKDNYGADDGKSIVAYFLGNAQTWRGPIAKACKAELNRRLKAK